MFRLSDATRNFPFNVGGPCTGRLALTSCRPSSIHRPPKRHCSRAASRKWDAVRGVNPYIWRAMDFCKRCSISGVNFRETFSFFFCPRRETSKRCAQLRHVSSRRVWRMAEPIKKKNVTNVWKFGILGYSLLRSCSEKMANGWEGHARSIDFKLFLSGTGVLYTSQLQTA